MKIKLYLILLTVVSYKHANKQKTKNKLNKAQNTKQNKSAHTENKVPFVLANYSRAWGLLWTVMDIPNVTPITS